MSPKQRTTAPQNVSGKQYSAANPKSSNDAQDILQEVWNRYVEKTTQRTKLLDSFMAFLVVVGALQFLYVVLVGNFVSFIVYLLCTQWGDWHAGMLITCYSLLTLSCPDSALVLANLSLQRPYAFKPTLRTRRTSRTFRTSGHLLTMCLEACCCTSSV